MSPSMAQENIGTQHEHLDITNGSRGAKTQNIAKSKILTPENGGTGIGKLSGSILSALGLEKVSL